MADNLIFEEVVWVISEKSILQTDFEGEKLARMYTVPGKNNILHWKKILLTMNIMLKKKSYTVICQGKISNSRGLAKNSYRH